MWRKLIAGMVALLWFVAMAMSVYADSGGGAAGGGSGSGNPTSIAGLSIGGSGSAFSFFANPQNIVPPGTGNIWYVDCVSGNNSNSGKSPAAAFLTYAKATSVYAAGDVIVQIAGSTTIGGPVSCTEDVVIAVADISIICSRMPGPSSNASNCEIDAADGNPALTIAPSPTSGAYAHVYGIAFDESAHGSGNAPLLIKGGYFLGYRLETYGSFDGTDPSIEISRDTGQADASQVNIQDTNIKGGGVKFSGGFAGPGNVGYDIHFIHDWFQSCSGMPCLDLANSANSADTMLVEDSTFSDFNYAAYTNLSSGPNVTTLFKDDTFNSPTLTIAQLALPASGTCEGCSPSGAVGSVVTVNKTITSSNVKVASPTNILTASGDVYVNSIIGMTDGTGLAGCTNYVIKQDRAIGGTTAASQAITDLGASVTFDFSKAATTALLPFSLASGGHIQDQATAGDCTGSGTMQLSVTYRRLTPYASLQ